MENICKECGTDSDAVDELFKEYDERIAELEAQLSKLAMERGEALEKCKMHKSRIAGLETQLAEIKDAYSKLYVGDLSDLYFMGVIHKIAGPLNTESTP